MAAVSTVATAAVGGGINVVTGGDRTWLVITATVGVLAASAALEWLRAGGDNTQRRQRLRGVRKVDRPVARHQEMAQLVRLLQRGGGTVGITTALGGAGGFGKTTLARMAASTPAIMKRFPDQIEIIVGQGVEGAALANKINSLIEVLSGQSASYTDPDIAGQRLGQLLDEAPQTLLLVDDVWTISQVTPFTSGGSRCARIFTTRVPSILPADTATVVVDQMSSQESDQLLTRGLTVLNPELAHQLVVAAGRWPLLLSLINGVLRRTVEEGRDVNAAAQRALSTLESLGPTSLDVSVSGARELAVEATVQIGIDLLGPGGGDRFAELGIFPEDTEIPLPVIRNLWAITGGSDPASAEHLARRMAHLSLVTLKDDTATVSLHDIIRVYLRHRLGETRLAEVNQAFVMFAAGLLPQQPDTTAPSPPTVRWWELPTEHDYIWRNLVPHLRDSGDEQAADVLCTNLHWLTRKLETLALSAVMADLLTTSGERAATLRGVLGRSGNLLQDTEPRYAITQILLSRLSQAEDWREEAAAFQRTLTHPILNNRWPLPDASNTALIRSLVGHVGPVRCITADPAGRWLASVGDDATLRFWDTTSGSSAEVLTTGHRLARVAAVAGTDWIVTVEDNGTLRVWDIKSRTSRKRYIGSGADAAVALAPDGHWLATAGQHSHSISLWRTPSGRPAADLGISPSFATTALVAAPDSHRLFAADSESGLLAIVDVRDGRRRFLVGPGGHSASTPPLAAAIDPESRWLALGHTDGTLHIVGLDEQGQRRTIRAHIGAVHAVAASPDGSWIATGGADKTVRVWDPHTGERRASFLGHLGAVRTLAVGPDSAWLASGADDGRVNLWDVSAGEQHNDQALSARHLAILADSATIITSGHDDGALRLWDLATGSHESVYQAEGVVFGLAMAVTESRWVALGWTPDQSTGSFWDAAGQWELKHLHPLTELMSCARQAGVMAVVDVYGTVHTVDTVHRSSLGYLPSIPTPGLESEQLKRALVVMAIALSHDASLVATVHPHPQGDGEATRLIIRTLSSAAVYADFPVSHNQLPVSALELSSDATWLVLGTENGLLQVWTLGGALRAQSRAHRGTIHRVSISPDGSWIASVSDDGSLRIWEPQSLRCITMMRVDGPLSDCAWMPDGLTVIAVGTRGLYAFDFLPATEFAPIDPS